MTLSQMIFELEHCDDAAADRLNDRLQQCNVRIQRENGDTEPSFSIRTRQQLIAALKSDPSIKSVEYKFNGRWTVAAA